MDGWVTEGMCVWLDGWMGWMGEWADVCVDGWGMADE